MSPKSISVAAILLGLAGLVIWVNFGSSDRAQRVDVIRFPGGSLTFALDPPTTLRSLRVVPAEAGQLPPPPAADAVDLSDGNHDPEALWSLREPSPEQLAERPDRGPREVEAISYGRPWRTGLRPRPGTPRRGAELQAGVSYRIDLETDNGSVSTTFEG